MKPVINIKDKGIASIAEGYIKEQEDHGIRIYAADVRGYGRFQVLRLFGFDYDGWEEDYGNVMNYLEYILIDWECGGCFCFAENLSNGLREHGNDPVGPNSPVEKAFIEALSEFCKANGVHYVISNRNKYFFTKDGDTIVNAGKGMTRGHIKNHQIWDKD